MRTGALVVGGLVLGLLAGLQACGSSDDSDGSSNGTASTGGGGTKGCNEDPWSCPEGQTCWIADNGSAFKCLNSGQGQVGDECDNFIDHPTCADDLTCFAVSIPGKQVPQVCSPYCDPTDPAHACPNNGECIPIKIQNTELTFFACLPEGGAGGAGGTGGAGGAGGTGGAGGGAGGSGGAGNAGGSGGAGGN